MPRQALHPERRRPRVNEMDRIDTKCVRPYVQGNEPLIFFPTESGLIRLGLTWQERKGGIFGPQSAATANRLRRSIKKPRDRFVTARIRNPEDRGLKTALILYLSCPLCSRRCRVLYSRKGRNEFGCTQCNRPAYRSNCWPYTGRRNARGISLPERERLKHEQAAKKIRDQLTGDSKSKNTKSEPRESLQIPKPARMSQLRFEEMNHLIKIQEQLALLASLKSAEYMLQK